MQIFGHRGAPGWPRRAENTIGSFREAIAGGADGIELDVRRCRDGRIVVIHDATLNRTTNGKGRVSDCTWAELSRFKCSNGESVPLLDAVLDALPHSMVNIEFKESGMLADILHIVRQRQGEDRCILSAFECWEELAPAADILEIALLLTASGLSKTGVDESIRHAQRLGAKALHVPIAVIGSSFVRTCHAAGLAIRVFTVNDTKTIRTLLALGIDAVFTDFPTRAKHALQ